MLTVKRSKLALFYCSAPVAFTALVVLCLYFVEVNQYNAQLEQTNCQLQGSLDRDLQERNGLQDLSASRTQDRVRLCEQGEGPVILSVDGSFVDGSEVEISGTNFGVKDPAVPLLYADFESGLDPSPLGQRRSFDEIQGIEWSPTEGIEGSGAAKAADGSGRWAMRVDYAYWTTERQKFYVYKKVRTNFIIAHGNESQNWKIWRMWPEGYGYPDIYAAATNGRVYVEALTDAETGFWSRFPVDTTDWVTQEITGQASSAINEKDGVLVIRNDNSRQVAEGTIMTRTTEAPRYMSYHYVVHGVLANIEKWDPPWSKCNRMWVDNLYVDTSWARVLLGDAATYTECQQLVIQIPSAWSDEVISITAKTAGFLGPKAFLYVIDADGAVNTEGFPVKLDGGA